MLHGCLQWTTRPRWSGWWCSMGPIPPTLKRPLASSIGHSPPYAIGIGVSTKSKDEIQFNRVKICYVYKLNTRLSRRLANIVDIDHSRLNNVRQTSPTSFFYVVVELLVVYVSDIFQIPILPEIFVARNEWESLSVVALHFMYFFESERMCVSQFGAIPPVLHGRTTLAASWGQDSKVRHMWLYFSTLSSLIRPHVGCRHLAVFREAGALTGGMNYHRAYFRNLWYNKVDIRIDHQVLILWAEKDKYARPEMAEPPRDLVPHAKMVRFPKVLPTTSIPHDRSRKKWDVESVWIPLWFRIGSQLPE